MSQRIIIKISPTGEIEAVVDGIKGPACEGKLDALLQGIGKVVEDRATPEYWQDETTEAEYEAL